MDFFLSGTESSTSPGQISVQFFTWCFMEVDVDLQCVVRVHVGVKETAARATVYASGPEPRKIPRISSTYCSGRRTPHTHPCEAHAHTLSPYITPCLLQTHGRHARKINPAQRKQPSKKLKFNWHLSESDRCEFKVEFCPTHGSGWCQWIWRVGGRWEGAVGQVDGWRSWGAEARQRLEHPSCSHISDERPLVKF